MLLLITFLPRVLYTSALTHGGGAWGRGYIPPSPHTRGGGTGDEATYPLALTHGGDWGRGYVPPSPHTHAMGPWAWEQF